MPDRLFVIVARGSENLVTDIFAAKLIFISKFAIDGEEIETAFGHPWRNSVRKPFPSRQIHEMSLVMKANESHPSSAKVKRCQEERAKVGRYLSRMRDRKNKVVFGGLRDRPIFVVR